MQEMRLDVQEGQSLRQYVRGVGGEGSDSVRVEVLELPWLEMAGHRFDKVSVKHSFSFCTACVYYTLMSYCTLSYCTLMSVLFHTWRRSSVGRAASLSDCNPIIFG